MADETDGIGERVDGTPLGDVLGATEAAIDTADPVSLGRSYLGAMRRAARRPLHSVPAWLRYGAGLGMTGTQLVTRAVGVPLPEVDPARPGDARFRDPTWQDNIVFHGLHAGVPPHAAGCCTSWWRRRGCRRRRARRPSSRPSLLADALAPTNLLLTNPRALKRAFETGGTSVVRGAAQLPARPGAERRLAPAGRPLARSCSAATSPPRRGRSCSATSSSRCSSTTPTTDEVYERPLLVMPAVDQPLLHRRPRAGQEPRRVGGRPRPHHVRGELPQPRRRRCATSPSTTTCASARSPPSTSCARSRAARR